MERPAKVPRLHRPGQRVNPPPDPHLPIRRSPNSVPIALELETSVDIAANQLDLSEDYCLADEYAIDDDPHVEWALRPLLPTAGTAHSHGPKRTLDEAFSEQSVPCESLDQYLSTAINFPDYLPYIPRNDSPTISVTQFVNPFFAPDGDYTHPGLLRHRIPVSSQTVIEVNGFIKGNMKIPGFDERQTVPVDYSMPLRRSWLQQEHDRMQQSHSVVRERKDARDPVLKAVGLSQPVQLPSGFGDVKLKKLDAMLWDFFKVAVCGGRTVVPLDNTYLKQIMPMAQKSSLVRHAILALASSYVLDWYFNQQIEMRATHHYQQTVKLLGQELGDGENQEPDHGEPLIATLILLCHNENINWDIDHAPEKYPKWYHSAHLAKKILDASNPAVRFQKPDTVQFTRARIQLAIRVCLDGVLSDCVFPLETEPKKCGHVWLNMGTEWDKRRIDAFAGLSPELMHHFVKITHLSGRRLKRPDSVIIPITGHEIENVLDTMWQWTPIASTIHTTSEALLKACRESLNEEGKVASAAAVTELTAASYLAAAQIYLHCRLFRRSRRHPLVQEALERLLETIAWQPTEGHLFTAQTPLFSVCIGSIVAFKDEDRATIRAWFDPICQGARGNVPPVYNSMKYIWTWLDDREKLLRTKEGLGQAFSQCESPADGPDLVARDNTDAWWEDVVRELTDRFGRVNLS